jgi:hypothetical protein
MEFGKEITFESISCINVSENDILVLKADRLLKREYYIELENELSRKCGCKVVIIESGFEPVSILKKQV